VLKDRVVLTRYSTEDGTLISQSAIDADMLNGTLRLNPRKKGESQFVLNSSGNKLNCTNCPVKDRYNVWVKADVDQLWEVQNYGKLSVDLRGYKYALDLAGKPTVEGY
jgi:hypothetical protein